MNDAAKCAVFLMLLLPTLIAASSQDEQYFYVSYGVKSDQGKITESFSINSSKRIFYRGHAGLGMKLCDKSDPYYCFNTPALSFAVPRSPITAGQEWTKSNRTYYVARDEAIELLGRSLAVQVIVSTTGDDRKVQFYYSRRYGLVAVSIEYKEHERSEFYFSKSLHGFPMKP